MIGQRYLLFVGLLLGWLVGAINGDLDPTGCILGGGLSCGAFWALGHTWTSGDDDL